MCIRQRGVVKVENVRMDGLVQAPAKKWEELLLSLGVDGSEPGIEGDEIAPLAKENVATP